MNSHCHFSQSQHFYVATFQALRKVWRTFGADRQRAEKIAVSTVGPVNFRWIRSKRTTCQEYSGIQLPEMLENEHEKHWFSWDQSQFNLSKNRPHVDLLASNWTTKKLLDLYIWVPPTKLLLARVTQISSTCQPTSQSSSSTRKGFKFWRISAISCRVWGRSWWANLKPQCKNPGYG